MMNFFRKGRGEEANSGSPGDVTRIAKLIGPLIDGISKNIFNEYHELLLREPITYIVYAVWGAKSDGELTREQTAINGKIIPVLHDVMNALDIGTITQEQTYAVEYIVRSLLISKIVVSIEMTRAKLSGLTGWTGLRNENEHRKPPSNGLISSFLDPADLDWRHRCNNPNGRDE